MVAVYTELLKKCLLSLLIKLEEHERKMAPPLPSKVRSETNLEFVICAGKFARYIAPPLSMDSTYSKVQLSIVT